LEQHLIFRLAQFFFITWLTGQVFLFVSPFYRFTIASVRIFFISADLLSLRA